MSNEDLLKLNQINEEIIDKQKLLIKSLKQEIADLKRVNYIQSKLIEIKNLRLTLGRWSSFYNY